MCSVFVIETIVPQTIPEEMRENVKNNSSFYALHVPRWSYIVHVGDTKTTKKNCFLIVTRSYASACFA